MNDRSKERKLLTDLLAVLGVISHTQLYSTFFGCQVAYLKTSNSTVERCLIQKAYTIIMLVWIHFYINLLVHSLHWATITLGNNTCGILRSTVNMRSNIYVMLFIVLPFKVFEGFHGQRFNLNHNISLGTKSQNILCILRTQLNEVTDLHYHLPCSLLNVMLQCDYTRW